jgi:hypothetical protein
MNDSARGNGKEATVSKNNSHVVEKERTSKQSSKIWPLCLEIGLLTFGPLPESGCDKKESCNSATYWSSLTKARERLKYT